MRGDNLQQEVTFSYFSPEARVPQEGLVYMDFHDLMRILMEACLSVNYYRLTTTGWTSPAMKTTRHRHGI
jgi:hypothetical protein